MAFYCTESQDRIPDDYFELGKAIWSEGRPFLIQHALRLGLRPDAVPPPYAPKPKIPLSRPAPPNAPPPRTPVGAMPPPARPAPIVAPPAPQIQAKMSAPPPPNMAPNMAPIMPRPPVAPVIDQRLLDSTRGPDRTIETKPESRVEPKVGTPVDAAAKIIPPVAEVKPVERVVKPAAVAPAPPPVPPRVSEVPKITAPAALKTPDAPKPPAVIPASLVATVSNSSAQVEPPAPPAGKNVAAIAPALNNGGKSTAAPPTAPAVPAIAKAVVAVPDKKAEPPKLVAKAPAALPAVVKAAGAKASGTKVDAVPKAAKLYIPLQPGEPLSLIEMKKLEILQGIPEGFIKILYGGIVRRKFKQGDLICRQGEYASTAFFIESGTVEVYVVTPDKAALAPLKKKQQFKPRGLVERFRFWAQRRKDGPRKSKTGKRPDVENVADSQLPSYLARHELKPGTLVGEMSCINFYPRSANVRAKEDCVVLELIRTVLDTIREKNGTYRATLDKNYKERTLIEHLNTIRLFKGLDQTTIDQLIKKVQLKDFNPGETIFKQGDESDAFYLVRRGCIKVVQNQPGGEIVLTYLGQNDSFGEIGLLRNVKRTASCVALDHVEVVKIERKHFDFLILIDDEFKARMERETDQRLVQGKAIAKRPPERPLGEFIDQELMQAQNVLLLDLEKCTRCDECVKACVDSHDDGITRLVREGLRFDKYLLASSCRSCMDPVCMIGCPVGSIRREETFEIIIEDWCIGCKKCAVGCPYGNITMHELPKSEEDYQKDVKDAQEKDAQARAKAAAAGKPEGAPTEVAAVKSMAVTCDQCSTLQDPSCVYACPHEAAMRVNAREFFEITGKSSLKEASQSVKTD